MCADKVPASYSARAAEYIRLLGSMKAVHPSDRQLVTSWAATIAGTVIDVGCGPGHWTDHLTSSGCDALGIDPTPSFVEHARATYPDIPFVVAQAEKIPASTSSVGGVLAWYSLIHHEPGRIRLPLEECARVLRPGGTLLMGFFEGATFEPFDHAVVTAYRWPVSTLSGHLDAAGFDVVETHTRTGSGYRPHGAIWAVLKG